MREELTRLRDLEASQGTERLALREAGRQLGEEIETVRKQIETAETELAARRVQATELERTIAEATRKPAETEKPFRKGFWLRGKAVREAKAARESRQGSEERSKRPIAWRAIAWPGAATSYAAWNCAR